MLLFGQTKVKTKKSKPFRPPAFLQHRLHEKPSKKGRFTLKRILKENLGSVSCRPWGACHLGYGLQRLDEIPKVSVMKTHCQAFDAQQTTSHLVIPPFDNRVRIAYRANTLQAVCARLEIRLIYCRPYHPTSKGKLEKWHSFVRSAFLNELDLRSIHSLDDININLLPNSILTAILSFTWPIPI